MALLAAAIVSSWWALLSPWLLRWHVPSYSQWSTAASLMSNDWLNAIKSTSHLLYLTIRPLVYMLVDFVAALFHYVFVQGVYHHGLHHLHALLRVYWNWQSSLTRQQVYLEVSCIIVLLALHQLYKFLERQTYTKRVREWYSLKRNNVSHFYASKRDLCVQKYSQTLHRLGRVSALLAVSLPHALFVCFGGLLWLLAPSAVAFLATQTLLKPFLSTLLPLGASILLVHDNLHTTETPLNCKTPGASKTRPRTAVFSRTHPKKQEPHLTTTATAFADTLSPSIEDRTQFWLEYWIVHASLQCLIAGLNALPFIGRWMRRLAGMNAVFSILELFFYVWIYTMPYLLPQHHHYHSNNNSNNIDSNNNNSSAFPEGRPLRVLSRVLRPIASRTVSHIASIVSPTTWDTYIINTSSPFLQLAVTLRIISLSTNQWIQTAIQQGRFVVLPFLWLFVPVPGMASFAVLYTQFFLPLSKTAKGSLGSSTTTSKQSGSKRNNSASKQRTKTSSPTRNSKSSLSAETDDLTATATLSSSSATWPQLVALQYWILHSLITVIIHKLSYVLWVIPFSNVVLFVFWWYLSWNVSSYYQILERDLQLLGVLQVGSNSNDGEHGTVEATTVYRVCTWILERLPSAAGVNATMDEAGEHAAMVGDDDDDKPGNSDSDDEDELSDCQFPTETQDNLVKKADRDESKGGQSRSKSPATRQRNSARTKPKEST